MKKLIFPRGCYMYNEIAKIHRWNLKIVFCRTTGPILSKLMYIFISVSSSVHPLLTDENNVFQENCLIPKGTFLWILWRISQGIPITLLKMKYYNVYSSNRLYILHYCYFICSYVFRFMSYCSLIKITRDSRLVCMLLSSLFLISM